MNRTAAEAYLDSPPLVPGDRVHLIAASSPTDAAGFDHALATLEGWGLEVVVGEHVRAVHPDLPYLAGTDEQRRADLEAAWCDPRTSAVIALRGGYGAMRLLDGLDFSRLAAHATRPDGRPKLLAGSSDVTALHQAWAHHLRVPTLFCPMVGNAVFRTSTTIAADVRSWLFEPWRGRSIAGPEARTLIPAPDGAPVPGRITGGNLSLLAASLGAPENPLPVVSGTGIVLLEDVDETPARLDNLLLQLVRSGWTDGARAIALGSWEDCGSAAQIEALVHEVLGPLGIPVVWELGFGHAEDALSVPLGAAAALHAPAGDAPALTLIDPKETP
ncbi:muramoyltetrapeptide carboxypeptidase [Brevibacterium pityocampae]